MGLEPEFEEFWKNTDFVNSNDTVILYSYRQKARGILTKKDGRGERIRTSDSCVPNAVLYQAELHPEVGLRIGILPEPPCPDTALCLEFLNPDGIKHIGHLV